MGDHYLTVGYLKDKLQGLPDNTPVYYQRIEDLYFKENGWKPDLLVPNDFDGEIKEEFLRAFTAFQVKQGGKKHLCITAHY